MQYSNEKISEKFDLLAFFGVYPCDFAGMGGIFGRNAIKNGRMCRF